MEVGHAGVAGREHEGGCGEEDDEDDAVYLDVSEATR